MNEFSWSKIQPDFSKTEMVLQQEKIGKHFVHETGCAWVQTCFNFTVLRNFLPKRSFLLYLLLSYVH